MFFPFRSARTRAEYHALYMQLARSWPVASDDKVYSAQKAVRRLIRVAPQIKTEIIPHAGHGLWMVQADLVARKPLGFLGEPEKPREDTRSRATFRVA